MNRRGFTLVEVLVAIAMMGIVMLAVLNLQNGTINVTTNVTMASNRLEDQTVAMSYIADRFRGARVINPTSTTPITLSGTTTCDNRSTSTNPCIAFVAPESTYGDATGAALTYVQLAYRYEARTGFTDRNPEPWADANGVEIIREYRRVLSLTCGSSCTDTDLTTAANATGGTWTNAMLADGFTRTSPTGSGTFSPWTITNNNALQISIRSYFLQSGAGKYFPVSGTTTVAVLKRN